jgi:hypothetical protein
MDIEGCGTCLQSPQGILMMKEEAKTKATKYGRDNRVSTAIYWDGTSFQYVELSVAIAGNYPIAEVLSFHLQAPNEQVH